MSLRTASSLLYVLAFFVLGLNYVRNLVAHRYRSDGDPISYEAQLADSINIESKNFLTELFFPLGLRYHALTSSLYQPALSQSWQGSSTADE